MTQDMYLVSIAYPQTGKTLINGVVAVVTNATSSAVAIANAALACNAAFNPVALNAAENANDSDDSEADFYQGTDVFGSKYFDTAVKISADAGEPGSGNGSVEGDAWVIFERAPVVYVGHASYSPA